MQGASWVVDASITWNETEPLIAVMRDFITHTSRRPADRDTSPLLTRNVSYLLSSVAVDVVYTG